MVRKTYLPPRLLLGLLLATQPVSTGENPPSISTLKANGAVGFPQRDARVIFDSRELRFSVTNSSDYLYAQAIMWNDGDSSIGQEENGKEIGDFSALSFLVGSRDSPTPNVDRVYFLNPRPSYPGLYDSVILNSSGSVIRTPKKASRGVGSIRYISTTAGVKVRVDSYVIPLKELSRHEGEKVKVCYFGYSLKPDLRVNSAGYKKQGIYYSHDIPVSKYQVVILDKHADIITAAILERQSGSRR